MTLKLLLIFNIGVLLELFGHLDLLPDTFRALCCETMP